LAIFGGETEPKFHVVMISEKYSESYTVKILKCWLDEIEKEVGSRNTGRVLSSHSTYDEASSAKFEAERKVVESIRSYKKIKSALDEFRTSLYEGGMPTVEDFEGLLDSSPTH